MKSPLIRDFERTGALPTVDALLDWRIRLDELMRKGEYPEEWYTTEIRATDELLSKHRS